MYLLSILLSVLVSSASATVYCVNQVSGSDSATGSSGQCWQTPAAVQSHLSSFHAGDVVQFCRGDKYYQSSLSLSSVLGSSGNPVSFTSYDCRDTSAVIWPLPLLSTSSILPQSVHSSGQLQWNPSTVTAPSGNTVNVLTYNLSALEQYTGTSFIPANRFSGDPQIAGLWVGGVEYHTARFPNRVDPLNGRGEHIHEFLYLDSTTATVGGTTTRSSAQSLYLAPSTWPYLYYKLYEMNTATWCNGTSPGQSAQYQLPSSPIINNYYTNSYLNIRTGPSTIESVLIPPYTASTIDPLDFMSFVNCTLSVQQNTACNPAGFTMDDPRIHSLALPVTFTENFVTDSSWQPTIIPAPSSGAWAGSTLFSSNHFSTNVGPASYGGWTNGYYMSDHPDFLDAPGEYFYNSCTDTLYVVPLNDAHALLLNSTYSTNSVALDAVDMALAFVDQGIEAAGAVIQFTSQASTPVIASSAQGSVLSINQLQLGYMNSGIVAHDYASLALYNLQVYNALSNAITTSYNTLQPTSTAIFSSSIWNVHGSAILSSGSQIVLVENCSVSNASTHWGSSVANAAITVSGQTTATVRNNYVNYTGYSGISVSGTAPVLVELNVVSYSNQIHPTGSAIVNNYIGQWNMIDEVSLNTVSGIPNQVNNQAVSGLSAGVNTQSLLNNLVINASGPCATNDGAGSTLVFQENICFESGFRLSPYPASASAASMDQFYSNFFYYTTAELGDATEIEVPNVTPGHELTFSANGRQFNYDAVPTFAYLQSTLACIGLMDQITATSPVSYTLTPETAQFGSSYLQMLESNATSITAILANTPSAIVQYGINLCAGDVALAEWFASRNSYLLNSEASFDAQLSLIVPVWFNISMWPWPTVDGSITYAAAAAASSSSSNLVAIATGGTIGGVVGGLAVLLALRKRQQAAATQPLKPWTGQTVTPVVGVRTRPDIELA